MIMRYPGGKGQAGTFQRLINLIPPHDYRIITHLGGGNIQARLRPARGCTAVDLDVRAIENFRLAHPTAGENVDFRNMDAVRVLRDFNFAGRGRVFIYSDPPYVISARKSQRRIYTFEYADHHHVELLNLLRTLPAAIMISGLRCPLYDELIGDWHLIDYQNTTRGGPQTESVWLNYEPPAVPHDLRYAGSNYRERERIKRKRARWRRRLAEMPPIERAVILEALDEIESA